MTAKKSAREALFIGACSAALLAYSLYHHHFDRNVTEWKTSPFLFPTRISVFGLLLMFLLLAEAKRETEKAGEETELKAGEAAKPAFLKGNVVPAFIAVSVAYDLLMPHLHFIPSTVLYLSGLLLLLGERKPRNILLLSCIATGAVWFLFGMLLHVRLP